MSQESTSTETAPRTHHRRRRFNLAHSVSGVALWLVLEALVASFLGVFFGSVSASVIAIVIFAAAGGLGIVFAATEVIREVRQPLHMLLLLWAIVGEFISFFAMQYWYLSLALPASFTGLELEPITLLLQSTMVLALNPIYLPATVPARALMLSNTLESLVLALFVFQNVWQIRDYAERGEIE